MAVSVPIPPCVLDLRAYPHLHFSWCPRGQGQAYYTVSYNGRLRPCNHASAIGDLRTEGFAEILARRARLRPSGAPCPTNAGGAPSHSVIPAVANCPAASYECYGTAKRLDPFVTMCR